MIRPIIVLLLAALVAHTDAASNAGDFLYFPFDPQAATMGEGIEAIRFGAVSALRNPATLARSESRELFIAHTFLSLDRRLSALAFGMPLGDRGALGLGIVQAAVTEIDGRDTNGRHTSFLEDTRNALSFVFGFRLHPRVTLGVGLKALFRKTAGEDASGTGFDAGVSADAGSGLTISAAARNLGASWPWNSSYWADALRIQKDDDIPAAFALSVGSRSLPLGIHACIGIVDIENEDAVFSGGVQFPVTEVFIIRGGGSVDSPELGFGLQVEMPFAEFLIDYSFGTGEITSDSVHQVSLTTRF